jgi:hypothetical protein
MASHEDNFRRLGKTRSADLNDETCSPCPHPCRLAPSDLQLPSGEVEQLEQTRSSLCLADQIRRHDQNRVSDRSLRAVQRLSRLDRGVLAVADEAESVLRAPTDTTWSGDDSVRCR